MCSEWQDNQTEDVTIKEFDLLDHFKIIEDPEVVQYILKVVTNKI